MTDLNPEIWKNKTLGSAAPNVTLNQLEAQQIEDRNARAEGREPRLVVRDVDYPRMTPSGSVPSSISDGLHFEDANSDTVDDEFKFDFSEDNPTKE